MNNNTNSTTLTPRRSAFVQAYTDPASSTFGNAYQSALTAGYSIQTARNFTPQRTAWLSDFVGHANTIIEPDDIMRELTAIINNTDEPTIVRLKAIEMTMKAYSMMVQRREQAPEVVTLNIDLSSTATDN